MTTYINQYGSRLEIAEITDVVVTPIEEREDGKFVREFRFFGAAEDGVVSGNPLTLAVRCISATRAALEVTTPPLQM